MGVAVGPLGNYLIMYVAFLPQPHGRQQELKAPIRVSAGTDFRLHG
jgi:hypothetical protein